MDDEQSKSREAAVHGTAGHGSRVEEATERQPPRSFPERLLIVHSGCRTVGFESRCPDCISSFVVETVRLKLKRDYAQQYDARRTAHDAAGSLPLNCQVSRTKRACLLVDRVVVAKAAFGQKSSILFPY